MRTILWIAASVAAILTPNLALGFMQDLPPELQNKSDEEQRQWLDREFQEAYTLQLKVAQERHEARMERRDALVQKLAEQAFERQQLITQAEQETRRELEEAARQSNLALGGFLFLLSLGALGWWWVSGRRAEVLREPASPRPTADQARADIAAMLEHSGASSRRPRRPAPPTRPKSS